MRILCLVGSPVSTEWQELSELYARGALEALDGDTRHEIICAHVSPDEATQGIFRMPTSLDAADIARAEPLRFAQLVAALDTMDLQLGLPQMFCVPGMTCFRALFELLNLPFIGNPPLQMGIAADKGLTRAIVADAGIRIPSAHLVKRGETPPAGGIPRQCRRQTHSYKGRQARSR